MANLKDLRNRKRSIQATRKITAAMKMIAAAKLKRAAERAERARPYGDLMHNMVHDLVGLSKHQNVGSASVFMGGGGGRSPDDEKASQGDHLIVVLTSNRGLCGGFNSVVARAARQILNHGRRRGLGVKILCIGHRGRDQLKRDYGSLIVDSISAHAVPEFAHAIHIADTLIKEVQDGTCTRVSLIYNRFVSALQQEVVTIPIIPIEKADAPQGAAPDADYEYEPGMEAVLTALLPRHIRFQIFQALLESAASEQGARMTAMDGATRNAGDMIRTLDLLYNRTRQAQITKELIEIISGAEAV